MLENAVMAAVFLWLLCAGAVSAAAQLEALPPLPDNDAIRDRDWLVHPIERKAGLYRTTDGKGIVLSNGLIRRVFRLTPNAATVGFDNLMTGQTILRGVKPEARVEIDGIPFDVGGLGGQPNYAFLLEDWVDQLAADPASMQFTGFETGPPGRGRAVARRERFAWKRVRHHAPNVVWPPEGVYLRMDYRMPQGSLPGAVNAREADAELRAAVRQVRVSVHYEIYDGIPALSKWITVENHGERAVTVTGFSSEILAVVEYASAVEERGVPFWPPNVHVETDFSFGGMSTFNTMKSSVHWVPDPAYATQVNYARLTPCLLEVRPTIGPAQELAPGATFTSFRTFLLPLDSYDRERNGLARRRLYRTIAPWVTENPLMMHVRYADRETVENAIDQCAEAGFEMAILTFGSGFDMENDSDTYLATMTQYADYARSKGIEIGGYSLLASRSIDAANDVVMPPGQSPTFGHSPCLLSPWGIEYFRKLRRFFEVSHFSLLEHDGSYPGDVCMATEHPGHTGLEDSQWKQWRQITGFYQWCRKTGIYLNVPDYYYLAGSNKCAMGYRETNWSLPRTQQVIHTRQNIYDGTWEKTPSMGWMFVPLTEYHGGGAAATIEPLDEHLDHYEAMLSSNLAMGVQACYRGPRLYDTDRTKALVKQWVAWFKEYRDILESDLIHGRRADGRGIDWMLHVNPRLAHKGMLVVFNPLETPVKRELKINLYYTGIEETALIREGDGRIIRYELDRRYNVKVPVAMPAGSFTWFVIE